MIEFPPEVPNVKLLKKVVRWSMRNRYPIPTLNNFDRSRSYDEIKNIANAWQEANLGEVIEGSDGKSRYICFVLKNEAFDYVNRLNQKSLIGQLKSVNRSDWIAIGAFFVSLFALFNPGS